MTHYSDEGSTLVLFSPKIHPTRSELCSVTSPWFLALPQFAQMSKPVSRLKLPNLKLVLRYDLMRLIISSHVGSLSKFWVCAYRISTIVNKLASPLLLILVVQKGPGLGFRLAQFRKLLHNIHVKIEPASNYHPNIPHGACYLGQPAECCLALPQFAQMSKTESRLKLPNLKLMLGYDLTRWNISSHVGSLSKFWLCAYWIFTIVTRLTCPSRLILVLRNGWGLGFTLAQSR